MIDLHTHTNESDGSFTPDELVRRASELGLEALAITDHDTFAGHEKAVEPAQACGLDLVCGIELSARAETGRHRAVHLLGYFLHAPPTPKFRAWLVEILADRRERNQRLVARLQGMGVEIELEEVERHGRTLTGRPHFAKVLVEKGFAANSEDAFRRYLAESAPGYVERHAPSCSFAIQKINDAGGLAVLAHPIRLGLRDRASEESFIAALQGAGLGGLEVYHSDHGPDDTERYKNAAQRLRLAISGGSDFHGEAKPQIALGSGLNGNLTVSKSILDEMRRV